MSLWSELIARARSLVMKTEEERELDEEIRFHIERETRKNLAEGMSARQARRKAHMDFGGVDRAKERTRDSRGVRWLEDLVQDTRLAARALSRKPGFAAVALLTVAVGIGANTAIFSVVQGVLLKPLPYRDSDRIVRVALQARPTTGVDEYAFSEAAYRFFADNNRSFEALGGYGSPGGIGGVPQWMWRMTLTGDGPPQTVTYRSMTVSSFEVLGVEPTIGRLPRVDDIQVALISHRLWVDRYGADPSIVGRSIAHSTSQSATRRLRVIGVMPDDFAFPDRDVDVWTLRQEDLESTDIAAHDWLVIARLGAGVSTQDAATEAESLIARFGELGYSGGRLEDYFTGRAIVRPLKDEVVGDATGPLLMLLGMSACLLLIACANVASLQLLRAESRAVEDSVRVALGAGRGRMIQSTLMETVQLAVGGGLGGVLLAFVGTRLLVSLGSGSIPRMDDVNLDGRILLFGAGITVLSAVLFGYLPARHAASRKDLGRLRGGGRGSTIGSASTRTLSAVVVAQIALALVLLVSSGLFVRSSQQLRSVRLGFDPQDVLTFQLAPPRYQTSSGEQSQLFYDPLVERLNGLPGVVSAGAVSYLPLSGESYVGSFEFADASASAEGGPRDLLLQRTTPGYFRAMGIPLLQGRDFAVGDYPADYSQTAFVISTSLNQRYWPNESALGKRLTYGGFLQGPIIGVVGDVHQRSLDQPPEGVVYMAHQERSMDFAVRTTGRTDLLLSQIRDAVAEIDPDVPITHVRTMDDLVRDSTTRTTFAMTLLLIAAAIGLFLAAVGTYGVVTYVANQRTAEMGLRLALGADPSHVQRLILSRALFLSGVGVVLGLVGSVALARVLRSMLFNVSPFDALTLGASSLILLSVATVSSLAPARRASDTQPASALRSDS